LTDWRQPFAVLLAGAGVVGLIHQDNYRDRLAASTLGSMGALVVCYPKVTLGEVPTLPVKEAVQP